MKVTEYRTMLYLPQSLYSETLSAAKRRKTSLSAFIREALSEYLSHPPQTPYRKALRAGFGLWKKHPESGVAYENRLRSQWKNRV